MNLYQHLGLWLEARQGQICHRQLLLVSGPQEWAEDQAIKLTEVTGSSLWLGEKLNTLSAISNQSYQGFLGQEVAMVVYNAHSGFRANAAMAVSGMVQAGGLMVLLCPPLDTWPSTPDPEWQKRISFGFVDKLQQSLFVQTLIKQTASDQSVAVLTPTAFRGTIYRVNQRSVDTHICTVDQYTPSAEQQQAIQRIYSVATGHRHRPFVLSADRGRGKSSAIGMAAGQLIQQRGLQIVVTAPALRTVEQVFKHAQFMLPTAERSRSAITANKGSLRFIAPDELLASRPALDVLLIDEAAALPTHVVIALLEHYPRVVLCTTLHGYEGSGRGFELRVKAYLQTHKTQWRALHLSQPLRWYANDCLEAFWFDLMLMQEAVQALPSSTDTLTVVEIDKQQLLDDRKLVRQIFQLLVSAHYQTSPDDLMRLYDAPEQHCFTLMQGKLVVGVVLVLEEGGEILTPLAKDIASGKRRVNGHLVAQQLSFHAAQADYCQYTQWRVSRIAIAPEHQRQGHGRRLLRAVLEKAALSKRDLVSTAFGANLDLLSFWQRAGFQFANLGLQADVSSGEHSGQWVFPLSSAAQKSVQKLQEQGVADLAFHSDKSLSNLPPRLLSELLRPLHQTTEFTQIHFIKQFIAKSRSFGHCQRVLREFILQRMTQVCVLPSQQHDALVMVLLQGKPYRYVGDYLRLTGRQQIEQCMRDALLQLMRSSGV